MHLQALEDLTFRYDEETILNAEMAEKIAELEKRTVTKEVSSYILMFKAVIISINSIIVFQNSNFKERE